MGLLAYCVLGRLPGDAPHGLTGVDDRPVHLVTNSRLSLAVSPFAGGIADADADMTRVIAFQRVVERLPRERTVLPIRFGSLFADETDVLSHLHDRRERYQRDLSRLDGCVEMGVTLLVPRPAPSPAGPPEAPHGPGGAYLESRRQDLAQHEAAGHLADEEIARWNRVFDGLIHERKTERPCSADPSQLPVRALFLVPREAVETLRERFRAVPQRPEAPALLVGPLPPYSFVE